jgi:hypothetical protein
MEETMVGADLSAESAAPAAPAPAEPGTTRDSFGNVYDEPRQGSAPAPGSAAAVADVAGAQTAQPAQTPPVISPAEQQAQARLQQALQLAQQAEQRVAREEQARWEHAVRQLPPDQQRVAVAQRQSQIAQAQMAAMQRQAGDQQALYERFAREVVIGKIAQQYAHAGVTTEMLSRFDSPQAMEAFAKGAAELRRGGPAAVQAQTQQARAAAAGAGSPPATRGSWRSMSRLEQLSAAFAD